MEFIVNKKKNSILLRGNLEYHSICGGILSPLLSNLVLHELDLFITNLIKEREKANEGISPTLRNPAYYSLSNRIYRKKVKLIDRKTREGAFAPLSRRKEGETSTS